MESVFGQMMTNEIFMKSMVDANRCIVCSRKTELYVYNRPSYTLKDRGCFKYPTCFDCSTHVQRIADAMYGVVFSEDYTKHKITYDGREYYVTQLELIEKMFMFVCKDVEDTRIDTLIPMGKMYIIEPNLRFIIYDVPKDIREAIFKYAQDQGVDIDKMFVY